MQNNMEPINSNKLAEAKSLIDGVGGSNVKYIKKEPGLLEREKMDDDKIILTEDNRQILLG